MCARVASGSLTVPGLCIIIVLVSCVPFVGGSLRAWRLRIPTRLVSSRMSLLCVSPPFTRTYSFGFFTDESEFAMRLSAKTVCQTLAYAQGSCWGLWL